MKGFVKSAFFFSLVILLSFWAVKPLFVPGFFPMHDDTQVSRVYEMAKALSYGQFPVRWVGDLGYGFGYPLFNFYAPLPYYIGAIFNNLGFDALMGTKIMFLVGILLAGVTMFLFLNNLVGETGALVGSLLYMYAPYHAVDIYVRGAVGEFYALAFLPLIFLGIYKILAAKMNTQTSFGELKKGILAGSLGFSGVLLSHNILGMVTAEFLIAGTAIYLFYKIFKKQNLTKVFLLVFVVLLGIGLSSFFAMPAVLEKNFTRVNELTLGSNNFSNHFVYIDQLWNSPWGYAGSAPGRADGMSFMAGKIHLLLGLLSVPAVYILYKRRRVNNSRFNSPLGIFNLQLTLFLIFVFLMLQQSEFIWKILPGFSFIQYPWRFLVFAVFSLSVMIAIALLFLNKTVRIVTAILLVFFTVWFNSRYFVPKEYLTVKAQDYTSDLNLRYKISKISDEYLPDNFSVPKGIAEVAWQTIVGDSNLKIVGFTENPTKKVYKVDVSDPNLLQANLADFPGWQVKIDGKVTAIQDKNGRIEFFIPEGRHDIEFNFTNTPIRILANTISLLSLFLLGYIIVLAKADYVKKKKS